MEKEEIYKQIINRFKKEILERAKKSLDARSFQNNLTDEDVAKFSVNVCMLEVLEREIVKDLVNTDIYNDLNKEITKYLVNTNSEKYVKKKIIKGKEMINGIEFWEYYLLINSRKIWESINISELEKYLKMNIEDYLTLKIIEERFKRRYSQTNKKHN